MTSADLLFACIRYSICGLELREEERAALGDGSLKELYVLSARHDLAHLVCDALQKNGLLPENEVGQVFRKQKDLAVYRYIQQAAAFEEICSAFENAKIPYVPLKGSVIREYYPEPWMRTSADLDILVHEEDLERSFTLLTGQIGYKIESESGFHHASLYSPEGVHLELHFQIKEGRRQTMDAVLGRVWEYVVPVSGKKFHYHLTNEFFLFYHLAHMSDHFTRGGCGIRPFMDCFLLKEKLPCDWQRLDSLLERGGLRKFSDMAFSYGAAWLSGGLIQGSQIDRSIQNYVLSGGVYGTMENSIRTQQAQKGTTSKNILNRLWLPYDTLQINYGAPAGRKYLSLFYQIKRWFILIFQRKRLRHGLWEIRENMTVSDSERSETKRMLAHLGLTDTRL